MPTYEYQCPDGHVFEKFQKMTEKPRAKCPVCGKTAMRKISGGAGLVFKGSGFYITDYGKDGKGPRKDPAPRRAPSPSGKSDTAEKPAAAKEPAAKAGPAESSSGPRRRRPPASERRAPRRALAGGRAARRRRGRVRPGASPRRRPWRPRHQPRHGARQEGARQPAQDRRARARGASPLARPRRPHRDRRPRVHQLLAGPEPAGARAPAHSRPKGRPTAGPPPPARSRSTSSSSRPIRRGRCTWATAEARRWATASPRCYEWTGHTVTREFYINDAGVQIDKLAQSLWARVQEEVGRTARDSRGRLLRRVPAGERPRGPRARGTAVRRPPRRRRHPPVPGARARDPAGGAGQATSREFGVHFDVMTSEQAIYDGGKVDARPRAAGRARAHVRGRGGALAPHHRVRRRQGSRAPEGRRDLHLSRARHRLSRRQARARLRPRHRCLGRRPSRVHPAHAGRAAGARLSARLLRRGAGAAREGGALRRRGEDVEARRASSSPCATSSRKSASTRRAISSCEPRARRRWCSTSTRRSSRPTRTRSSTSRWPTRG